MALEVVELLNSAKAMTHEQRADLVYHILLTLDESASSDPAEVQAAWHDELNRRVDDFLAGNANTISVAESHHKIRAELVSRALNSAPISHAETAPRGSVFI